MHKARSLVALVLLGLASVVAVAACGGPSNVRASERTTTSLEQQSSTASSDDTSTTLDSEAAIEAAVLARLQAENAPLTGAIGPVDTTPAPSGGSGGTSSGSTGGDHGTGRTTTSRKGQSPPATQPSRPSPTSPPATSPPTTEPDHPRRTTTTFDCVQEPEFC